MKKESENWNVDVKKLCSMQLRETRSMENMNERLRDRIKNMTHERQMETMGIFQKDKRHEVDTGSTV